MGVGASAGGLDALGKLFTDVRADVPAAFVVVTHQHGGHTSLIPEILSRQTALTVSEARRGDRVAAGHVYVAPPGMVLEMHDDTLEVYAAPEGDPLPIDTFLRSLARSKEDHAACIILSGSGTDGTLGARAVKGANGLVMAQSPDTAAYDGMPRSVLGSGVVDYELSPEEIVEALVAFIDGTPLRAAGDEVTQTVNKILTLLRARTTHDFSCYKRRTIRRRIERRMQVHHLDRPKDYLRYLQENSHEIDILFKELLIGVTRFFRDPEAWMALQQAVLLPLIKGKSDGGSLRVWIPGCATGEEACTVAILIRETLAQTKKLLNVQIFATDLDMSAIETARRGVYPAGISADVSPKRLARYFVRDDGTFKVRAELREMIVFAPQNVTADPPFMRMDLICCRNLLIYLDAKTQRKLLPLFHYALNPHGVLFLGTAETLGSSSDLFTSVDNKWKLFRRKEVVERPPLRFPAVYRRDAGYKTVSSSGTAQMIERTLLENFAPSTVIANERGDIIYIHGRTGQYLEPSAGQPSLNVLRMAREGLELAVMSGIRRAIAGGVAPVVQRGVQVRTNGGWKRTDVTVTRLNGPEALAGLLMITFEPSAPRAKQEPTVPEQSADLEQELQFTKENLQTTIEELETTNEELKSTNEELQSTNEELQSANEELETSKEELQSVNEELETVNAELQIKIDALSQANDDMRNLLNSTEVATLFLDNELRIKRFTRETCKIINVIPSDVGRPIGDLSSALSYGNFESDARRVLLTLEPREIELKGEGGRWYRVRIMPHRTTTDAVDGLVVTFIDITAFKAAIDGGHAAWAMFVEMAEGEPHPLAVLDDNLIVMFSSAKLMELSGAGSEDTTLRGQPFLELANGVWDQSGVRAALHGARDAADQQAVEVEVTSPANGEPQPGILRAQRVTQGAGGQIVVWIRTRPEEPS